MSIDMHLLAFGDRKPENVRYPCLNVRRRRDCFPPDPAICRRAHERPLRRNGAARLNGSNGREADAAGSGRRIYWPVQGKDPAFLHRSSATVQSASGGGFPLYHEPVLAMLVQGSAGGSASPACSSSREMPSGVRMKAMRPSRGGRLTVRPRAMKALQVS
jgi:hypothetical protein